MRTNPLLRRLFFALFIFTLAALPLWAQGEAKPEGGSFLGKLTWQIKGSIFFFPEDNGKYSDPMKVLPSLGAGASYPLTEKLRLEMTMDFYTTHYGYSSILGRAVPDAIENRTARVLGFVLGFHAARYFDLTSLMTLRAYGGPAIDMRIVFLAEGLDEGLPDIEDIRKDVDEVRSYFWSKGRWFLPVVGAGLDFAINPRFKLGIDMRIWIPIYRIWSGENLPAIEGWRFGPGITLTIR